MSSVNDGVWPGTLGISKRLFVVPNSRLTRLFGSSRYERLPNALVWCVSSWIAVRSGVGFSIADLVAEVRAGEVVAEGAGGAVELEARLDVAVAADRDRGAAAVLETRVTRADVDDGGGSVAVLRRQRAGDETDAVGEARLERLAEAADRLGNDDAVDPVLDVRVVAANVQLAERVLDDAGALQDDLVERRRVAERQVGEVLLG